MGMDILSDQNSKSPLGQTASQHVTDEQTLIQDYTLALQKTLEAKRRDPSEQSAEMHQALLSAVEALSKWKKPKPDSGQVIELVFKANADRERDT